MSPEGMLNRVADSLLSGFDDLVLDKGALERAGILKNNTLQGLVENAEAALTRIDAKAGATLTHISMMIAAAAFMISRESSSALEKIIISADIVAYLFLALCCLRCLVHADRLSSYAEGKGDASFKDYEGEALRNVVKFGLIINFAIRWTFLVTFIFALSVIAHIML